MKRFKTFKKKYIPLFINCARVSADHRDEDTNKAQLTDDAVEAGRDWVSFNKS